MAPSIELAEEGFEILPGEALRQASVVDQLREFEGTRQHFFTSDSNTVKSGERLIQKDLAQVLKKIAAEGHKGFYEGDIAEKMVADIQKNGGVLTLEDLKTIPREDLVFLKGPIRDTIYTAPFCHPMER